MMYCWYTAPKELGKMRKGNSNHVGNVGNVKSHFYHAWQTCEKARIYLI